MQPCFILFCGVCCIVRGRGVFFNIIIVVLNSLCFVMSVNIQGFYRSVLILTFCCFKQQNVFYTLTEVISYYKFSTFVSLTFIHSSTSQLFG